jgi:hypothetical protein
VLASTGNLVIIVRGRGGHASAPHMAADPIPVACEIGLALQTLVTRSVNVFSPAVLTDGLYSRGCGRERITDDCLVVESDLVYETRATPGCRLPVSAKRGLQSPRGDGVVVSGPTGSGGEVYISTHGRPGRRRPTRGVRKRVDWRALAAEYPVYCTRLADLVWAEIDTPAHFERRRTLLYPKLRGIEGGQRAGVMLWAKPKHALSMTPTRQPLGEPIWALGAAPRAGAASVQTQ